MACGRDCGTDAPSLRIAGSSWRRRSGSATSSFSTVLRSVPGNGWLETANQR